MNILQSLIHSRKVALAVVGLIGVLLAHYSGLPNDVQASIVALIAAVILGIAVEDHGTKSSGAVVLQSGRTIRAAPPPVPGAVDVAALQARISQWTASPKP
jgi:hypothetical protein